MNYSTVNMDPQALDAAIESALTRLGYENLRPMQKLARYKVSYKDGMCSCLCQLVAGNLCASYWLLPSVFEHLRGIACCTVIVVSPLDAERPRARGTRLYSRH